MPANGTPVHPMRRLLSNRRGLLAGASALVGAGLARLGGPDRTEAAHIGSDQTIIHAGQDNRTAARTKVTVSSSVTTPAILGVWGESGLGGSGSPNGVQGVSNSTAAGAAGVYGLHLLLGADGIGVRGQGIGAGVRGEGAGSNSSGVVGVATGCDFGNSSAVGVGGSGRDTDGVTGAKTGVLGITGSTGIGVEGWATRGGTGIRGLSNFGGGPDVSGSGIGVEGRSGSGNGVRGQSTSGVAVFGQSTSSHGCGGTTASSGQAGLFGLTSVNGAVAMLGVHTLAGGTAAFFQGTVTVVGGLQVIGGPKNALVPHPDGSHRRMYSMEAPEPWFEDFGTAQLANGRGVVDLDPDFDAVVRGDDYLVFLTPVGAGCGSLYVSRQGPHRFEVASFAGATASGTFNYRLVSRRKEDVGKRMEKVQLPAIDVEKLKRDVETPAPVKPTPRAASER